MMLRSCVAARGHINIAVFIVLAVFHAEETTAVDRPAFPSFPDEICRYP
jgi:hypothetical protein